MYINKINFSNTLYYSILVFAFCLALSKAMISVFIILLPILWLIQGDLKYKFQLIINNQLMRIIILYILYTSLSIFWSQNTSEALDIIRINAYLLNIFVIFTSIKKDQIQTILTFFLAGMFISEITSYLIFFELISYKNITSSNPSPFMFHIHYSVYMALSASILLNRLLSTHYSLNQKLILGVFFITITGNLFLTNGRTGQVAFIFSILFIFIRHYHIRIRTLLLSFVFIGAIFTIAFNNSDTFKVRVDATINDIKNISQHNLNGSLGIRVAYYITTYDIIKNESFFGVGIGDYLDETKSILNKNKYPYISDDTKEFMGNYSPHNQYLLVLLQTGIIGLLIFISIIYFILKLNIKDLEIKNISIIFAIIFFLSCMTESLLLETFPRALFILFVGILSVASHYEKQKIA
jgi:O-antigen ligase